MRSKNMHERRGHGWKLLVSVTLGLMFSSSAWPAPTKAKSKVRQEAKPITDLLRESQELRLQADPIIQQARPAPRRSYYLSAGPWRAQRARLDGVSKGASYDLSEGRNAVSITYSDHFWRAYGQWGFQGALSYALIKPTDSKDVLLHALPMSASLSYRLRTSANQWLTPALSVGPGYILQLQRGIEGMNTSEGRWLTQAGFALVVDLQRWFDPANPAPVEAVVQLQRWWDTPGAGTDMSGSLIQVGLGISL